MTSHLTSFERLDEPRVTPFDRTALTDFWVISAERRAKVRIGTVLRGKWRIDRLIGLGGMAAVYEGTHRNGKRGAIKILHSEHVVDPETCERFVREGYAANRVDHPGAVSVIDDDVTEDGAAFLVMDLLEGETVDAYVSKRPEQRIPIGEALAYIDQLLDVLAAAHDSGIIHRDIKPENLFLTKTGDVKILDFGLARIREASTNVRRTKTGNSMGTPAFMPREQALGHWSEVDARTDLWAVGACLYTMITGRLVHRGETGQEIMLSAMTKPARPLASVLPSVDPAVARVVDRALAFERKDRWPNARAMQEAIREARAAVRDEPGLLPLADDAGTPAREAIDASTIALTTSQRRGSRAAPRVLGTMLVAAVIGGGAAIFWRQRHAAPPQIETTPQVAAEGAPATLGTAPAVSPIADDSTAAGAAPSASASAAPATTSTASAQSRAPQPPRAPSPARSATPKKRDPMAKWD